MSVDDRDTDSPQFGGSGGDRFELACGDNGYVTAISGNYGTYINRLNLTCSNNITIGRGGTGEPGSVNTPFNLACPAGFSTFGVRAGELVDKLQVQCGSVPSTWGGAGGGPLTNFICSYDQVLTGMTVSAGNSVDNIQFHCSAKAKCRDIDNILNNNCKYYCDDPNTHSDCIRTVTNYCENRMYDQRCRDYVIEHQGQFDLMMNDYCKITPKDELCGCYVQLDEIPAVAKSVLQILNANPQCWNSNCTLKGYQPSTIYNKKCPDLNLQACVFNVNIDPSSGQGNAEIKNEPQCNQYSDVTTPPSSSKRNLIIGIVISIVILLLIIGLIILFISRR